MSGISSSPLDIRVAELNIQVGSTSQTVSRLEGKIDNVLLELKDNAKIQTQLLVEIKNNQEEHVRLHQRIDGIENLYRDTLKESHEAKSVASEMQKGCPHRQAVEDLINPIKTQFAILEHQRTEEKDEKEVIAEYIKLYHIYAKFKTPLHVFLGVILAIIVIDLTQHLELFEKIGGWVVYKILGVPK